MHEGNEESTTTAQANDNEPNEASQQAVGAENTTVQHRRELLNDKLKNFRQEKMKRKIPVDVQLLECAKRTAGEETNGGTNACCGQRI